LLVPVVIMGSVKSPYEEVSVTKARSTRSDSVSCSAFQLMKSAYHLGAMFSNVSKPTDNLEHTGNKYLDETCLFLMNLWTKEEVVSASEDEVHQALYGSNTDDGFIPDMIGDSEIMDLKRRKHLIRVIPARCQGYPWRLVYSTSRDGFSLSNLYRKMEGADSSILLVIEDTGLNVFGALLSDPLVVADHFYGTGESFLYTFAADNFQIFKWSGDNDFFIRCHPDSIAVGAGDGHFGLLLDEDLNNGRTESCLTFANDPLSPNKDFVIKTLECWSFD
ncbi:unnamed protein product, partial [Darwinula stevensoni]